MLDLKEDPFIHAVVDDALDPALVLAADEAWPGLDWRGWGVHYNNALEAGKRACNDWAKMPPPCQLLLSKLAVLPVGLDLGLPDAVPDCSLWGGGMHSMAAGSHLDLHEDSDVHPHTGWCRRANAILFLNRRWEEEWGGQLEFWDAALTRPVVKVTPAFNRLVIFDVGDGTYHGVPRPLRCPQDVQRKSLAVFWFCPPEKGQVFKRPRANFVGPAGERDPEKEALRRARVHFT